jgi:ribosomal protein L17
MRRTPLLHEENTVTTAQLKKTKKAIDAAIAHQKSGDWANGRSATLSTKFLRRLPISFARLSAAR